jgi:hypothetical protein
VGTRIVIQELNEHKGIFLRKVGAQGITYAQRCFRHVQCTCRCVTSETKAVRAEISLHLFRFSFVTGPRCDCMYTAANDWLNPNNLISSDDKL